MTPKAGCSRYFVNVKLVLGPETPKKVTSSTSCPESPAFGPSARGGTLPLSAPPPESNGRVCCLHPKVLISGVRVELPILSQGRRIRPPRVVCKSPLICKQKNFSLCLLIFDGNEAQALDLSILLFTALSHSFIQLFSQYLSLPFSALLGRGPAGPALMGFLFPGEWSSERETIL